MSAVVFGFVETQLSDEVGVVAIFVVFFPFEKLSVKLYLLQTLLAPQSTVETFGRTVVHWASSVFPPDWITFRNLSHNFALSKLLRDNLILIFSDGSFRLSAKIVSCARSSPLFQV